MSSDPSLGAMLSNVPAIVWYIIKLIILGLAIVGSFLVLYGVGVCILSFCGWALPLSLERLEKKLQLRREAEGTELEGLEEGRRRGSADSATLCGNDGEEAEVGLAK
ncbi:hypothetical protein ACLMJK_004320 [Lecanora helva]